MIGILDYGVGNIQAFANIYESLNIRHGFVQKPSDFEDLSHAILPGVGTFDYAMKCLDSSGLRNALDRFVLEHRKPVLGVCVGFQMMARNSEEGSVDGLSWIDAEVKKIPVEDTGGQGKLPLPHMGWNYISQKSKSGILDRIDPSSRFYFLHSYYVSCHHQKDVIATVEYGKEITSVVCVKNIFGIQQHPEKSHGAGIQFLKNFAGI